MTTRAKSTAKSAALKKVGETLRSPGQPLDGATRAYFEPRFGYDFSRVRVHADPNAADSARQVNAAAYAADQHIVLGPNAPAAHSSAGRQMFAHELAHLTQQSARPAELVAGLESPVTIRPARDRFEKEADQAAAAALAISSPAHQPLRALNDAFGPIVIQRLPPVDRHTGDPLLDDAEWWRPPGYKGPIPVWTDEDKAREAALEEQKQKEQQEATELQKKGLDQSLRDRLLDGEFKDSGEYKQTDKHHFEFLNKDLDYALRYLRRLWAPEVFVIGIPAEGVVADSNGKPIQEHPDWVEEFTIRLMGQQPLSAPGDYQPEKHPKLPPRWSEFSRIAQRLIEAYLRAWDKKINARATVDENLGQLYANVGGSVTNDRAELFGGVKGWGNWCGPASQNAVALGLMRAGYRFKMQGQPGTKPPVEGNPDSNGMILPRKPKPGDYKNEQTMLAYQKEIAVAFEREVRAQGAFFLTNWAKEKDVPKNKPKYYSKRNISGKDAATEKLFPGDFIYIVNGNQGSPLSGHVATVIREEPFKDVTLGENIKYESGKELSRLYWISGNSKGVMPFEGAIRPELVIREMPHKDYHYFETAGWGNEFDKRKTKETNIERESDRKYAVRLDVEFQGKIVSATKAKRLKDPNAAREIGDVLQHKAEGQFFAMYKYQREKMAPVFAHFGASFTKYAEILDEREKDISPRLEAAKKETEAYVQERIAANQPFTTKQEYDPNFEEKNKRDRGKEKTGRYKPLIKDHSWVVSIVRASQMETGKLDKEVAEEISISDAANPSKFSPDDVSDARFQEVLLATKRRAQVKRDVLERYGLVPMPGDIEQLYPGATAYWDRRGAFE